MYHWTECAPALLKITYIYRSRSYFVLSVAYHLSCVANEGIHLNGETIISSHISNISFCIVISHSVFFSHSTIMSI